MSNKPTLIFVPGAWHGPEYWHKAIIPAFEAEGHTCVAPYPDYTGPNARAGVGVRSTIDKLSSHIEAEISKGRNVILLCHSFGGSIGSSAVKGFTKKDSSKLKNGSGRVLGICLISAFIAPTCKALLDTTPPRDQLRHYADSDGFEKLKPHITPVWKFYNRCSAEDQEALPKLLQLQTTASFEGEPARDGIYAGWADVPLWYLRCTDDHAVPIEVQDIMIEMARTAGTDVTTRTIDTDHSPFYSRPKETLEFVQEAVNALSAC